MNHPPPRFPPKEQLTMGIHTLQSLLNHAPERILRVFTEPVEKQKRKSELLEQCRQKNIPVSFVPAAILTQMSDSDSHQSFVAHVKGRPFYDVNKFLESIQDRPKALVLMLDQIFDPQNFGTILRSAECLGAAGVVWSKNRGTDLTPVVAKASSGASEWLPLIRISNLAEGLTQFQEGGFEAIATSFDSAARDAFSHHFSPRTLLILGSEGEGVQPLLKKRADFSLFIPMQGKIESLNVAQAAAVFLTLFHNQSDN